MRCFANPSSKRTASLVWPRLFGRSTTCTLTDESGRFELPNSNRQIRLLGAGFLPKFVPGRGHHVIELERSPTLRVRLIDARSGEPIDKGEVFVVYASAAKKGPFPTNRAGVRVTRVLKPGDVRVLGRAEGFEESQPRAVTLKPGEETEVVLELTPQDQPKTPDP